MPTVLFPDQLVEGYPNAKVILTETGPEQFVKSMEKSFYSIINDNAAGMLLSMDGVCLSFPKLARFSSAPLRHLI